ncbi:hypothetical protein LRP31_14615 [Mesorhizobium mediterraneum]|uniref:hypothetical protein n=1 Tax=Mesorhizobium TaxID=68287 RepID=UPI001FDA973F|nr:MULTISPECIES: hypothetical protein [Mesorhizobium]WIW56986.1 hypothetical protein LRP31_14615 [Mesorhizobium mediterraneum]
MRSAPRFINAAGLGATTLARSLDGLDPQFVPELRYAKGNYFSVAGRAPFSRLVYPIPEPTPRGRAAAKGIIQTPVSHP